MTKVLFDTRLTPSWLHPRGSNSRQWVADLGLVIDLVCATFLVTNSSYKCIKDTWFGYLWLAELKKRKSNKPNLRVFRQPQSDSSPAMVTDGLLF